MNNIAPASRGPSNIADLGTCIPTVTIDGIPVFAGSAAAAAAECLRRAGAEGGRVATANLDFLALARKHRQLRSDLQASHLVVADGMPIVWLARLAGAKGIERMAGVDLVAELFRTEREQALRVVIFGSTEPICEVAVTELHRSGNGARVVHCANPPFRPLTESESREEQEKIRSAAPDVVLVALGCPAQERLIAAWYPVAPNALWIGIGGTLDFFAGVRKRAPRAAQRSGLEWLVRMAQEPRRLGKRYLLRDLPALIAVAPGCARSRLTRSQRMVR